MKHITKAENNTTIINPYQLLAEAIILRAVDDYRKALKYDHRGIKRNCEKFFRSEWFSILTNLDGETLIKRLRAEVQTI